MDPTQKHRQGAWIVGDSANQMRTEGAGTMTGEHGFYQRRLKVTRRSRPTAMKAMLRRVEKMRAAFDTDPKNFHAREAYLDAIRAWERFETGR